ncbi:MAG: Vi polysaccharide biosynthesis UDP-N-acetylglucosamine C-6 dehydrogenase TviB, partial [Hydrogenovibrio sp.]|nr:Vi polysaccharide biosynthesis UDP-N-acetylglucosamine C-6 dehydrogenase TviB [Hydrogenovibrio sp.]
EAEHEYGLSLLDRPQPGHYDAVMLAVPHREYAAMTAAEFRALLKDKGVFFDLKGIMPLGTADLRL